MIATLFGLACGAWFAFGWLASRRRRPGDHERDLAAVICGAVAAGLTIVFLIVGGIELLR